MHATPLKGTESKQYTLTHIHRKQIDNFTYIHTYTLQQAANTKYHTSQPYIIVS